MVSGALAAARLEFPGASTGIEGEGQLSTAVRVDGDLIVRFPKHAFGIDRLKFEVKLLDRVRPHLTLQVPQIVRVELDRPVGQAFVAHRAIAGVILTAERVRATPPDTTAAIARQVATILEQLHSLVEPAASLGAPVMAPAAFAASLAAEVETLLAPRMTSRAAARAEQELADLATVPGTPLALCHTDIGGNILWDDATNRIAVIDFGSCFVTHPALDVASLSVLGEDFMDECASHYPLLGELQEPATRVRATFALQDALYGARQDDWPYVDDILASYSVTASDALG